MPEDQEKKLAGDAQSGGLTRLELASIITTAALFAVLAVMAWASARNNWTLALACSVGGLGGLIHEIAQSRGKILFFQKQQDGIYLGTVAGVVLGAVAGILTIRGYLTGSPDTPSPDKVQMTYEIFLAGLALKGVVEAASGTAVPARTKS